MCIAYMRLSWAHPRPRPSHPPAGALGGRLDHTLSNLNTLHMFPHLSITLVGDGNAVRLLQPGTTTICPDRRCGPDRCAGHT